MERKTAVFAEQSEVFQLIWIPRFHTFLFLPYLTHLMLSQAIIWALEAGILANICFKEMRFRSPSLDLFS